MMTKIHDFGSRRHSIICSFLKSNEVSTSSEQVTGTARTGVLSSSVVESDPLHGEILVLLAQELGFGWMSWEDEPCWDR